MSFTEKFHNFLKVAALVATFIVTGATSKSGDTNQNNTKVAAPTVNYLAASNCPTAGLQERISVSGSEIVVPMGTTFKRYGFPTDFVTIGQPSAGTLNNVSRSCTYFLYQQVAPRIHLYTCYEFSRQFCQISFEETN